MGAVSDANCTKDTPAEAKLKQTIEIQAAELAYWRATLCALRDSPAELRVRADEAELCAACCLVGTVDEIHERILERAREHRMAGHYLTSDSATASLSNRVADLAESIEDLRNEIADMRQACGAV